MICAAQALKNIKNHYWPHVFFTKSGNKNIRPIQHQFSYYFPTLQFPFNNIILITLTFIIPNFLAPVQFLTQCNNCKVRYTDLSQIILKKITQPLRFPLNSGVPPIPLTKPPPFKGSQISQTLGRFPEPSVPSKVSQGTRRWWLLYWSCPRRRHELPGGCWRPTL